MGPLEALSPDQLGATLGGMLCEKGHYTMRGETIRLISARRSHTKEGRLYQEIIQEGGESGGV